MHALEKTKDVPSPPPNQRIRMFTMKNVMKEDQDTEGAKQAYIVPSKIFPAIWRQREHFDSQYASNMRLTKFIKACKFKDTALANKIIDSMCQPRSPASPSFGTKPSSYGARNRKISMGHMRTNSISSLKAPKLWTSGGVVETAESVKLYDYLLIACRYNLPEVAQKLIDYNANDSFESSDGFQFTSVYVASLFGSDSIVSSILARLSPEVCISDKNGCTPLHLMVLAGHMSEVDCILELGGDLLAEDCYGHVPLYYAYLSRDRVMCQYLWHGMSYLADAVIRIDLSRCALNFFPPDSVIARFQSLEFLDVSFNSIHYLPPSIGSIEPLKELILTGNPLKALPSSFIELSIEEQKKFLLSLKLSSENWSQRRAVVMGCPKVGKSSLIRALKSSLSSATSLMSLKNFKTFRSSVFPRGEREKESEIITPLVSTPLSQSDHFLMTHKPVRMSMSITPNPSVIFWELPGIIEPYTKFFLKGEVIFVVVYNLEELELCDIDLWLESIKLARGPNSKSPIFLVGTHSDNPLCSPDHVSAVIETLQQRYTIGQYKGLYLEHFVTVNTLNPASTSILRQRFAQLIQSPKFADKMFPPMANSSWLIFKELLHNQESFYMTKEDVYHALHACAIPKEELYPCLSFLQSCDNLLYFDLPAKDRLLLILDLKWWVDTIIQILDPENPFLDEPGIISIENLAKNFPRESSGFLSDLIFVLEEEFLLFRLRENLIVIPPLLPEGKPKGVAEKWPTLAPVGQYECQRIYRYSQSAQNVFSSFQRELLHAPNVQNFIIWKEGLALTVNHQSVLIVSSVVKRSFQLHISIRYPQEGKGSNAGMMLVICEIFEGIMRSSYPQYASDIVRLIPCVHCIMLRVLTGKTFLFQYDECFRAVTQGNPFVFCNHIQSPSRCIRVDKLAPDIGFADIQQIKDSQFTTGRLLGRGAFGFVYHGVLNGKHEIAIKEMILGAECSEGEKVASFGEFLREAYIMSFLHHPNLVGLFGVCLSSPPRLLMEYIPCGDLQHLITSRNEEPLQEWLIKKIALDIAIGMDHLHSITPPIIHRDLRSPNIFLVSLEPDAPIIAKIADFGLSRMQSSGLLQETLSTYQWMAPETLGNGGKKVEYDEKADVYSYAIILWEIITLQFPFDEYLNVEEFTYRNPAGKIVFNCDAVKIAIENIKLRPTIPDDTPEYLEILIRKCWSHKPANRPSFAEVIKMLAPDIELAQTMNLGGTQSFVAGTESEDSEPVVSNSIICSNSYKLHDSDDYAPCSLCVVGDMLWIGCYNGLVMLYDIRDDNIAKLLGSWQAHVNAIYSLVVCQPKKSEQKQVWVAGTDGFISVYPENAREQRNMMRKWSLSKKKTARIRSMAVINTKQLISVWVGQITNEVSVWSCDSYSLIGVVTVDKNGVSDIVQHSNGSVWIACGESIFVFDAETRQQMQKFCAHPQSQILAMLSVGDQIWTAGSDGKISVWDERYSKITTLTAHTSKIFCLSLDHRGFVWSGSFDTTIIVWDPKTWKPVEELVQHQDSIRGFGVRDDRVWSIALDNTLRCWNNK